MGVRAKLRSFYDALSRRPVHPWPDGFQHHGVRVALLVLLAAVTYLSFPVAPVPDLPQLAPGDVTDQDVIARVDYTVFKTPSELARDQIEAAAVVAPTFRYEAAAVDTMRSRITRFMAYVDSAAASGAEEGELNARLRQVLTEHSLPTRTDVVTLLRAPQQRRMLWNLLDRTLANELPEGVANVQELEESRATQLHVVRPIGDVTVNRDSVLTATKLYQRAAANVPLDAPTSLATLQQLILIRFFVPSLRLDRDATETDRENARRAVPIEMERVLAGERIIAAHERVTAEGFARLRAYRSHLVRQGILEAGGASLRQVLGAFALNLVILSIFGLQLFFYRPAVYEKFRNVFLMAVLLISVVVPAAIIARTNSPVELVPIAFATVIIAVLWDARMALSFALVAAILLSAQAPLTGIDARMLMIVGGAAAALSVRVVRRRAQWLILGSLIAVGYAFTCVALGLLLSWDTMTVFERAVWGTINGVAGALLAMGFLPLFEAYTGITTDQTLLELADLSRPLLKRLSLEASGTYAHSINVANLAEAAARGIGANPLLTRVGAYYHDIGKISTPQYFIENQARARNPHDLLPPATSAAIVRGHVLEGLRLAEQAKLPASVKMFIPEHHGTQAIGFFYDQARQAQPDADLDPAHFAYPGPKPRSRETAILMLADSVESAGKVLQEPTLERIRALVDRIVDAKIGQGQLDDAPLTLREITRIKEQFVSILNGMYHHRIDYPPLPKTREEAIGVAHGHH
ncbi:MAG: HD family phosphohydrolase [Longimicrobiales bacterium]